jgi:hypothetical protein
MGRAVSESKLRTLLVWIHYPETLSYFTDWKDAFVRDPSIDVVSANLATPLGRRRLRQHAATSDLIVALHSVVGDSLAEIRRWGGPLDERRGPLVVFVSNEVSLPTQPIAAKLEVLRGLSPDYIGTQLPLTSGEWLYADIDSARVLPMPHALNPRVFRSEVSNAQRPVDIGFRGARYLPHVGDDDRNRIIDRFSSEQFHRGFTIDIRTNVSYGRRGWSAFLNRCKGTIGAESGAAYLRRDDEILSRAEREYDIASHDLQLRARLRPIHRYLPRSVKNPLRRGADRLAGRSTSPRAASRTMDALVPPDGAVSGKCISSRHFDAIGTETCQILFPGRYNDLLEADRHYLRLEQDFSNLDDVLARFRDDATRLRLVREARAWALDTQTYRHRVDALLTEVRGL